MLTRFGSDRGNLWRAAATVGTGLILLGIVMFVVAAVRGAWPAIAAAVGSIAAAALGWEYSVLGPQTKTWPRYAARGAKATLLVVYLVSGACSYAAVSLMK